MFGERGQRAGGQGDGQGAAAGEGRQQEAEDEEGQDCIHATFQVGQAVGWVCVLTNSRQYNADHLAAGGMLMYHGPVSWLHARARPRGNPCPVAEGFSHHDACLAAIPRLPVFAGDAWWCVCVCVCLQVIFMTGWAPAPHQPKAAKRGSATVSFQVGGMEARGTVVARGRG